MQLRRTNLKGGNSSPPLFELLETEDRKRRRRSKNRRPQAQPDFLDLPSLHFLSVTKKEDSYEIEAEPSSRPDRCAGCDASGDKLHRHDTREQIVKDLLVREKLIVIRLHRDRYKCSKCGRVTQPPVDGIDHRRRLTARLLKQVELECLKPDETFRKIARRYGVDEKVVRKIFTKLIKRLSRSWRFETPRCLGIDEVYIDGVARCVLTDVENRRLANILAKRDMLTLRRHLLQIKNPERVEIIVIDMWCPYYNEVLKRFPQAVVVIDKYHVLRMATDGVISVHRRLRRGDKKLRLPKLYLLRKRKHTLTEKRRKELEGRLEQLPALQEAHKLKESFFNIWNSLDRQEAEQRFDEWVRSIPSHLQNDFKALLTAFENWRQEILNYFDHGKTNAFTESINGIIKHMQRLGRGYTFEVTRAKLLYGGPFSTQRTQVSPAAKSSRYSAGRAVQRKKKARRADAPPNPHANVQQMKQIRRLEDKFVELMRPPAGFVERFKHFEQLDFGF